MSKISKRLECYQIQMSIYAEQHKMILASDVLDMIEQLQDDLKDDVENVVAELEKLPTKGINRYKGGAFGNYEGTDYFIDQYKAIEIVRKGGVE